MSIFVLGGAGYLGSVLCRKLVNEGYDVTVVDKGFFGFVALEEIENKIKLLKKDAFDLTDEDLKNCTNMINLSGLSNDPMADFNPQLNFKLNTDLTEYTANLCKKHNIKRYIFASTASIYDFGTEEEKKDILVDETTLVNPTRHYSLSKYRAEQRLLNLADDNFKVIVLRKATISGYSPRMRYDLVINTFIKDALKNKTIRLDGGGENWRPLIDINDMCEIYIRCLDLDKTGIYNAVGYNIRISELALRVSTILKQTGYDVDIECNYDYPRSKIRNYRVDGSKLNEEIKFKPENSIKDTVEGIIENIEKIKDFDNSVYYNIRWTEEYLQHWLKY